VTVLHSLENHNYHIRLYNRCPYCELGSKPVPKVVILDALDSGKCVVADLNDSGYVELKDER